MKRAIILFFAFLIMLSSCGTVPNDESQSLSERDEYLSLIIDGREKSATEDCVDILRSNLDVDDSFGLWDDPTIESYLVSHDVSNEPQYIQSQISRATDSGLGFVEYIVLPYAVQKEDGELIKSEMYYHVKWSGSTYTITMLGGRTDSDGDEIVFLEKDLLAYKQRKESTEAFDVRIISAKTISMRASCRLYEESSQDGITTYNEPNTNPLQEPDNQKDSDDVVINTARHDDDMICICAQDIVKQYLPTPSTAKFCKWSEMVKQDLGNGNYQCTGWVDAQNEYGAMMRYDFLVYYTATEEGYKEGGAELFPPRPVKTKKSPSVGQTPRGRTEGLLRYAASSRPSYYSR